ncbi:MULTISPECIES: hypothetical protein [unclassified Streptomyces]|uniref:hypothetical protein n=1 Tax=unclassified Streptomyces TaxID=2593676 RepID=UPI000700C017|nr:MULTISPECIES: hypothetical protein [unclassified Streptomyces]KQX53261.1 hypothetical protein ASD33_08705 [Streptomyces sp. Root1304]KRA90182.1 hypothetical protein ASE09_08710 [Streptomyces sp. Root66D1]
MAVAVIRTPSLEPWKPLQRKALPAGRPREWYVSHNRRLKAMRLSIALLDAGVYIPSKATDAKIRATAATLGIHPPSDTTCRMVRALIRYGR